MGSSVLFVSTTRLQGLPRAPRPSVKETAVDPLPTTRMPGVGTTAALEGTEEGATAEDAATEEAAAVVAYAKRVTTEHTATNVATKEPVTEAAEDATAAAEGQRSSVSARGR
jgi:hypothetical protein